MQQRGAVPTLVGGQGSPCSPHMVAWSGMPPLCLNSVSSDGYHLGNILLPQKEFYVSPGMTCDFLCAK